MTSSRESGKPSPRDGELYGKELPQNQWIDVLPYTDPDRDRVSDLWELRKDGVGCHGSSGYPRFALPVEVHGDYDLEVEFTRDAGDGLIRIMAPVGDQNLSQLLLAAGDGRLYGFNEFDGHGLGKEGNPTGRQSDPLSNGKHYKLLMSVRLHGKEATIDASLDGAPLVHCTAPPSVFPVSHSADPARQVRPVLGVAADSDVTFHSARVRMAGGNGAIKARRPAEACPVGTWVDLLPRFNLARDRISGDFSRDGNELTLHESPEQGALMLPAAVSGSYELEIEFAHRPAGGMISLIVPVGPRRVRVNPSIRGKVHPEPWTINQSDDNLEYRDAAAAGFAEGMRHTLALKVDADDSAASIAVQIDGKPCLSWSGALGELHDGPILLPEGDRIGFVANGTVTVYAARVKKVSGTVSALAH
jgi:hypothetical protein